MAKFDQIFVGDSAELKHIITKKDIERFVDLTGDDNKLHIDAEYASKTSFKKPVAHGMLGASFISTIIGTKIPGDGALWYSQTLEFLLPVREGDEITVKAEVVKKIEQLQSIELKTDIYNQHKQKVTSGYAKVKIIPQETTAEQNEESKDKLIKNALVIGSTGGIGSAICLRLALEGYNIALHYHANKAGAEDIISQISNLGVKTTMISGEISSSIDAEEIVEKAVRGIGDISILINCATLKTPNIKFEKTEWSDFENHININVKSNFFLAQSLIPAMKRNNYGKFIFLTTQYTESTPPEQLSFYVTAKYSLNGFTKSLAVEMAPFNIKVNLVSPGMTETSLISDVPERARLIAAAKAPLRRLAKPEDVANAIFFLVSDQSNYMTGETIRVNGGQVML